jgi:hypothetical protein
MTAYFLNAGDAFVVSACYSAGCPTNTIPCEGRGVLRPCGEEFKPLFMRYRSSLDRFRCNLCCGSTPAPTLFSRNLPTFDLPFSSNSLRYPPTSRIARPWGYHTATFPPRHYAHSRTRLLHLFDVTGQGTPNATVLLFSRGDRYSPVAPILLRPTPCSHTEQRIGFRVRPWLFDVFVLEPRSIIPFTCARAFASLSHTRALLLPSSFAFMLRGLRCYPQFIQPPFEFPPSFPAGYVFTRFPE